MIKFRRSKWKGMIDVLQDDREEHFDIIKHNELGVYFCGYDAAELEQILTKMKALQDIACNMQGENDVK